LPVIGETTGGQSVGVITFSMGEAGYQHLFAYHPNFLPISRLTDGQWDDIDPAISPDGRQLVFASNRSGIWDLYLWDLVANTLHQLTSSPEVETNPDWSPDKQWIAYESYSNSQTNIVIRSVTDPSSAPIQLTEGVGNNFDPAWSPQGRQVAFSTDRSGRSEIWLAQLDTADDRFIVAAGNEDADFFQPVWSPDGSMLAWERRSDVSTIEVRSVSEEMGTPNTVGTGNFPFWSPDGGTLLTRVDTPNQFFLTGYAVSNGVSVFPLITLPAEASAIQWSGGDSFQNIAAILNSLEVTPYETPCPPGQTTPPGSTDRFSLVNLDSVTAPNPMLSETSGECFVMLRAAIGEKIGWDLLAILENAALPLTTAPDPAIPQNWLYTGRAISLNNSPLQAGWMAVSREDYQGNTYWRVWAKCLQQDGSCGLPITTPVWDFTARASGNLAAFEAGGKQMIPPAGYWVDITDIASQYAWQRLPSLNNWRTYYPGIRFNTLVFTQGKSWHQAMLELYPEDAISLVESGR
jgi:TolB protein